MSWAQHTRASQYVTSLTYFRLRSTSSFSILLPSNVMHLDQRCSSAISPELKKEELGLKHLLTTCKISQCDNKLVIQIWFETDRTGYTSYLFSLQSLHHRGWPCETTSARSHTSVPKVIYEVLWS